MSAIKGATKSAASAFGQRLQIARRFHGLTLDTLSEQIGITKQFLNYLEKGHRQPTDVLTHACGDTLGFDAGFFLTTVLLDEFREEQCAFRRLINTPAAVRKRVCAHGTLFGQLISAFESILSLPEDRVPWLASQAAQSMELAAQRCRRWWSIDADAPLANVTRIVERAGVVVTAFKGSADQVDAFSRTHDGSRKIVVTNWDKELPLRYRWNVAHELGHFVLHRPPHSPDKTREKEAHKFAACFLLPRSGFAREFPRPSHMGALNWDGMFRMRSSWGVSVQAIIIRAFDLSLITAAQYQRAYKFIHAKGWHRAEPGQFPVEKPELVETMLSALPDTEVGSPTGLARMLHWKSATLARVSGIPINAPAVPISAKIRAVQRPKELG